MTKKARPDATSFSESTANPIRCESSTRTPNNPYYYSSGLRCYENRPKLPEAAANVYYHGAEPCANEESAVRIGDDPEIELIENKGEVFLELTVAAEQIDTPGELVTTKLLGKAEVPQQEFTNPDNSPLTIDTDYFGRRRSSSSPGVGPFITSELERQLIKVWPKEASAVRIGG